MDRIMGAAGRRWPSLSLLGLLIGVVVVSPIRGVAALEVGDPAPEFSLASTTGGDIALKDFRGKRWVLIEFYGADFVPT